MRFLLLSFALLFFGNFSFAQNKNVLKEKIYASDYSKLSVSSRKLVDRLAIHSCDCYDKNKEEAQSFAKAIVAFSLANKNNASKEEVEPLRKEVFNQMIASKEFATCIKANNATQAEKDALSAELAKMYPQYAGNKGEIGTLKTKFVSKKMGDNCSMEAKKDFDTISIFMIGMAQAMANKKAN